MKINAEWHTKNKMPKNPTLDERIKWHLEHTRHCSCRPASGEVLEEMKKRYIGTHQEFWLYFTRQDHKALAIWAAACAERVLPLFEEKYPKDTRPRDAIRILQEWIQTGKFSMPVIRGASLGSHAAARAVKVEDKDAYFAARAAGQAVATAHVPTHALGPALYAYKAIAAANPSDMKGALNKEHEWQLHHIPQNLREWVMEGLKQKQQLLPKNLRSSLLYYK